MEGTPPGDALNNLIYGVVGAGTGACVGLVADHYETKSEMPPYPDPQITEMGHDSEDMLEVLADKNEF